MSGMGFNTFEEQDKLLLMLDGTRDCGAAARILQQQGFLVKGAIFCVSEEAAAAARKLGEKLSVDTVEIQIPEGWTDILHERMELLRKLAAQVGCKYISTAHYAQVDTDKDGCSRLSPCTCAEDDESDRLKGLPGEILSQLVLPLGYFSKAIIEDIAADLGL